MDAGRAASRGAPVALSLGSNIGDRAGFLSLARSYLCSGRSVRILAASSLYETQPVECRPQRWYLNQALWVDTDLSPALLLTHCQRVESLLGRRRSERHGPRTIDIDILFVGSLVVRTPLLTLPHAALATRRSILTPLSELGIPWKHPIMGATLAELATACKDASRVQLFLPELEDEG